MEIPPRRGRWPWLLLVMSVALQFASSQVASSSSSGSSSGEVELPVNDCAFLTRFCDWNATTASCVFRESVAFQCARAAPHWDCRWELTGDLVLADNVSVSVTGNDCALHISTNMLVLGAQSQLHAASVSVDAAFVRLEKGAELSAQYDGLTYRESLALFPGDAIRGASHGGSGGRVLYLNETTDQIFGTYFDVRPSSEMATLASRAWDLEPLWAKTDATTTNRTMLLLGSGSTGALAGGRIRVVASRDLVLLAGAAITANGEHAAAESASGGAGGSVFLSATALSLSETSRIQARGGNAYCGPRLHSVRDCVPGGGGGRVHIAYVSSQLDDHAVDVGGGALDHETLALDRVQKLVHPVEQRALVGAAGTYLRVFRVAKTTPRQSESDDQSSSSSGGDPTVRLYEDTSTVTSDAMLLITNRRGPDDATTSETVGVGAVTPLEINDTHRRIDSLVLMDGAAVATRGLALAAGDLSLSNGSVLLDASVLHSTEGSNALEITARHMTASGFSQMVLPAQDATFYTTTLVLDATTAVRFAQQRVTLAAAATLRVDAHVVGSSSASSLALIGGKDVAVGGAGLSAGALFLHADGSISVTAERLDAVRAASIDARFQPCDPKREKKSDRHASRQQIARAFLAFAEASNFTMLLQASHSIAVGISPDGSSMRRTTTVQLDATSAPLSTSTSAPVPPLPSSSSSSLPIVSLTASAILVCAENLINLGDGAVVASNGRGEQANQGPGTGDCVGSVGGGGGYGGRGADSSVVNAVGDFASGGLAYGTRSGIGMLGSGGGCVDGGAGGGVVMVGAQGIVLDGQVHCNGDGGLASGGGGSGGFLGLTIADFLRGHGRISAVGGGAQCKELGGNKALQDALQQPQLPGETNSTSSLTRRLTVNEAETQAAADVSTPRPEPIERVCGGGGGGGRLQLHGCERNDIDACTRGFDGNYTVAGGATFVPRQANDTHRDKLPRAASGSFVGFPCLPGSGGLFCRVCVPGTFKAESNSEECLVCTNAPSNAHYVGYGEISSACDWACDPGYSGDKCVSPIQQLLDACGGVLGFGLILLGIVGFLILLGYACRTRKEPSYSRTGHGRHHRPGTHHAMDGVVTGSKSERQHLLRAAIVSTQRSKFAWLLRWLYWPRVGYPKLVERDLPEHMARIYFTGLNDRDAPLKLRLTVPPQLRSVLYEDEFRLLAERINAALVWHHGVVGSFGEVVYRLVCVLCFPAASAVLAYRRHIRVNALKRIVARYNHACMKGPRARGLLNALKLGYSGDYSLVYLELLHKESSQSACVPTTAIGKPSLPIVLLFAGRGTYESPFYLDPSDLLVRSIPQCPELTAFIDEPWIAFVAELNELLRVVSNKDVSLVETLLPVAQFLEHEMAAAAAGGVGGGGGGGGGRGGGGRGGGGGGIVGASSSLGGKLGGLRIYLGRFYVGDEVDCGEEFKLGILVTTAANESSENLANLNQQWMGDTNSLQPTSITNNTSRYDGSSRYGPPRSMESMGYPTEDAVLSYDHLSNHWSYTPNNSNNQRNGGVRRGSSTASNNPITATASGPPSHKSTVSSIREEALRIRSNTSGSVDNLLVSGHRLSDFDAPELLHGNGPASRTGHGRGGGASLNQRNQLRRRTRRQRFYEGWLGPVDGSLPVPGVLISADELEDRLADRTWQQKLEYYLRRVFMPANVPASKWLGAYWMVNTALLSLLMVDLAITFAMVVNLRCVTNGEVDRECSATILMPVLLLPPLTLFLAPIMGIVSLAIASNSFSRRYAIWNALSMGNVAVAILACLTQSSRLVAPWFTAPLPLLPVIAMVIKGGEAYVVERYIALQETTRRRRGWRGLMKRRLSDASMPVESPYSSPVSSGYTPSYLTTTSTTFR